jgi:hypothetical protein
MIVPQFFRQLRTEGGESRLAAMYDGGAPFIADLYFGLFPIALFVLLPGLRRRGIWPALAVALFAYLIAIGRHTPLFAALYGSGLFRSIRYPEKFILTSAIVLIVLGAMALERLLEEQSSAVRLARNVVIVWTVLAGIAFVTASSSQPAAPSTAADALIFGAHPLSERAFWLGNLLRGVALAALLFFFVRLPKQRHLITAGLALFVLFDLWYLRDELAPRIERSYTDPPLLAGRINEPRDATRLQHVADWEWFDASATAETWMNTPLQPWMIRNGLFPRTSPSWGIPLVLEQDFDETHLLPTSELIKAMREVSQRGQNRWADIFAAMSNVGWRAEFVAPATASSESQPVQLVPVGPHPRYYLAAQVVPIDGRAEFVEQLVRHDFPPAVAFVEGAATMNEVQRSGLQGSVRVLVESSSHVQLETEAGAPSLLVASVTRHRYWSGLVDGVRTPLLPVNLAYQGLKLGPGKHRVELRYRNPLILPAAVVSLVALVSVLLLALARPRRATITTG